MKQSEKTVNMSKKQDRAVATATVREGQVGIWEKQGWTRDAPATEKKEK